MGIVEYNSAIYNPKGFDIDDVKEFFRRNGTLFNYPKATDSTQNDPLSFIEKPCDILIPAAIEKSIDKFNANDL